MVNQNLRAEIYRRDDFKCVYCGSDSSLSIDHVHPVSRGGNDEPQNLVTSCLTCNQSKGAKTLDEWDRGVISICHDAHKLSDEHRLLGVLFDCGNEVSLNTIASQTGWGKERVENALASLASSGIIDIDGGIA